VGTSQVCPQVYIGVFGMLKQLKVIETGQKIKEKKSNNAAGKESMRAVSMLQVPPWTL
jgi:hypothetical protein